MKTKKFKEFIKIEVDLNLETNNDDINIIDFTKYKNVNENKSQDELKKCAETIGLDLTKNLSKRIYLI